MGKSRNKSLQRQFKLERRKRFEDALRNHRGPMLDFARQYQDILSRDTSLLRLMAKKFLKTLRYDVEPLTLENSPLPLVFSQAATFSDVLNEFKASLEENSQRIMAWHFPENSLQAEASRLILDLGTDWDITRDNIIQALRRAEQEISGHSAFTLSETKDALSSFPYPTKTEEEPKGKANFDILDTAQKPHHDGSSIVLMHVWNHSGTLLFNPNDLECLKIGRKRMCFPKSEGPLKAYAAPAPATVLLPPRTLHAAPNNIKTTRFTTRAFLDEVLPEIFIDKIPEPAFVAV